MKGKKGDINDMEILKGLTKSTAAQEHLFSKTVSQVLWRPEGVLNVLWEK